MKTKNPRKKGNRYWLIPIVIVFALTAYIFITYYFQPRNEDRAKFSMYPGFGIELPTGYGLHGIDVSAYQQSIFWPSVKKMEEQNVQLDFVFIKATEGLLHTDRQFKRNWQKASETGITRGAYHFFLATRDAKAQAKNFIRTVKLSKGDLPPVIDIEELYGVRAELMRKRVKDFLVAIEAAYGVKPIIYTNAFFYNRYLGKEFSDYPLWVAHYYAKNKPKVDRDWLFWQHSCIGKVNGITALVDFNVFNGDSTAFNQLLVR